MTNPYDILGVAKDASEDEIKKAWKRLSMKHHPDRGGDEEKIKEINAAYDAIKGGDSHDPFIHAAHHGGVDYGFDMAQFEELLRQAKARHVMQVSVRVPIPFEIAIMGDTIPLELMVQGRHVDVEVTVPPGTVRGDAVRYPGLVNGIDIVIIYEVQPNPNWAISGKDIVKKQDVEIWDLVLGAELDVELVDGSMIRLRVPAGTQPNTTMRVPGKGIPARDQFASPGNLMVILNARIPKDIPEVILKAIRENKS